MADRDLVITVKGRNETGGLFRGIRHELESLKRTVGGRSEFKDFFEVFKGAGAIAGITVAAEVLANMTKAAGEFALEMSKGEKSASQLFADFARGIPFVRQGFELGEGIGDLVAGLGRLNGASEEFVERWTSAETKIKETKAALDELANVRAAFAPGDQLLGDLAKRLVIPDLAGRDRAIAEQRIKEDADKKAVAAIRERAELDQNLSEDQRKALRDQADRLERDAAATHKKERERINKEDADNYVKTQLEAQDQVNRSRGEARRALLEAEGRLVDAELDRISEEADQRIEAIKKKLAEDQKKFPDRARELEQKAIEAIDAEQEAAKRRKASPKLIVQALDEFFKPIEKEFDMFELKQEKTKEKLQQPQLAPTFGGGDTGARLAFQTSMLVRGTPFAEDTKAIRKAAEETARREKEHADAINQLAQAIRAGTANASPIFN